MGDEKKKFVIQRREFMQDAGKTEEIEALRMISVNLTGSGLYLESLFTPKFVQWVENKIKDDVMPDMLEWFSGNELEFLEMKARVKGLETEEERLRNEVNDFEEKYEKLNTDSREVIQTLQGERDEARRNLEGAKEALERSVEEADRRAGEMTDLKAELYDYMTDRR